MIGCPASRAFLVVLAIGSQAWLGARECRAGSIQNLLDFNKGVLVVGDLTFTFTANSVTSNPAGAPTAAMVDVTGVAGGIMFDFNPRLSLTTAQAMDQSVGISYIITARSGISRAGLSFSGNAVDVNTSSQVTEAFAGRNETLDVFARRDNAGMVTRQNNQSVGLADLPMTLGVTDTGHLSTGVRGNGATSTAQLLDNTNTFATVPGPASLVTSSIAAMAGLGVWCWRGRRRSAG
jgi:hypothetical protein